MKLNVIRTLLGTGAAVAFAAAALLPVGSSAQQIKGAQLLVAAPAATDTATSAMMPCAKCDSGVTSKVDESARGAIKPTLLVAQHACCDTSVKTVGVGKNAKNVISHNCSMGPEAACCK